MNLTRRSPINYKEAIYLTALDVFLMLSVLGLTLGLIFVIVNYTTPMFVKHVSGISMPTNEWEKIDESDRTEILNNSIRIKNAAEESLIINYYTGSSIVILDTLKLDLLAVQGVSEYFRYYYPVDDTTDNIVQVYHNENIPEDHGRVIVATITGRNNSSSGFYSISFNKYGYPLDMNDNHRLYSKDLKNWREIILWKEHKKHYSY